MSRSIGSTLRRTFTLPDEVPVWQRFVVAVVAAAVVLVATLTFAPDHTPAWVYVIIGWLGVVVLGAAASVLFRRFHPAARRADRDRPG